MCALIVDVLGSLTVFLSFLVESQWKRAPILRAPGTRETHIPRSALGCAGEDPVTLQERLAACFEKPSKRPRQLRLVCREVAGGVSSLLKRMLQVEADGDKLC